MIFFFETSVRSNPALCNVLMLLSSPTTPKMTFSMTQGDVYVEMVLQRQSYITIILVFKIRFKILLYDSQLFSQFRYMKMTKLNQVKVTDLELRHHTTKPTIRLVRPTKSSLRICVVWSLFADRNVYNLRAIQNGINSRTLAIMGGCTGCYNALLVTRVLL